ncbi:MAG: hypothetical protein ACK4UV_12215, partial [Ignavibacterium sp.]
IFFSVASAFALVLLISFLRQQRLREQAERLENERKAREAELEEAVRIRQAAELAAREAETLRSVLADLKAEQLEQMTLREKVLCLSLSLSLSLLSAPTHALLILGYGGKGRTVAQRAGSTIPSFACTFGSTA